MDLRLGGAAFQRIGKEMMTTKIMMMVTMMTMMMMMTFVGEGRGGFSQDWPINCDDDDNDYEDNDDNDYESGGGGVGDWHTHRSHSTHKPCGHLPERSPIGNALRLTFQLVTLATNLSC